MNRLLAALIAPILACCASATAKSPPTSFAATPASAEELTLFGFDNDSIPFTRNLYLTMHPVRKYSGNPVVRRGGPGSPDEYCAQLYGSVIKIGGRYHMWYLAGTPETVASMGRRVADFAGFSVCYAESDDGIRWTKPDLGLVELNGNKRNNMVQLGGFEGASGHAPGPGNVLVLFEPKDPEPAHRYKMMILVEAAAGKNLNNILPFTSADGWHWRQAVPGSVDELGDVAPEAVLLPLDHFEMGGFYHFQNVYYVSGQQISPYSWLPDGSPIGRSMSIFRSYDFLHWSATRSLGFVRWGYRSAPVSQGEEVHMPGAIWNRGNVLIGLYGQFHGRQGSKLHPLDLGLIVSNDGLHFREPVNDFVFLPRDPHSRWESGGVVQGQAYENVGDQTYVYYGGWDGDVTDPATRSEIGLAMLRRDGFGSLSPKQAGQPAALVTCALRADDPVQLWLNVDGLSARSRLKVEVLDAQEEPLAEYSGSEAALVQESGTRVQVRWLRRKAIEAGGRIFRLRLGFEGEESGQARLYALYLGPAR